MPEFLFLFPCSTWQKASRREICFFVFFTVLRFFWKGRECKDEKVETRLLLRAGEGKIWGGTLPNFPRGVKIIYSLGFCAGTRMGYLRSRVCNSPRYFHWGGHNWSRFLSSTVGYLDNHFFKYTSPWMFPCYLRIPRTYAWGNRQPVSSYHLAASKMPRALYKLFGITTFSLRVIWALRNMG